MSTKRLARTVIEGGRSGYNKVVRRQSHRTQRQRERVWLRGLALDPASWESALAPVREPIGKWHYDRLSAAERWLAKRNGQIWAEVEGEILSTFDTRSIAGQHIVFDHLLPPRWRPVSEWQVAWSYRFWVDGEGVLWAEQLKRKNQPHPWHWKRRLEELAGQWSKRAKAFVGDDRVGLRDHHAYWLVLSTSRFRTLERRRQQAREPRYAQGRPLTVAERAIYDALSAPERIAITIVLDGASSEER